MISLLAIVLMGWRIIYSIHSSNSFRLIIPFDFQREPSWAELEKRVTTGILSVICQVGYEHSHQETG